MNNKILSFFASIGLLITACIWGFAFVVVKNSLDYIGPISMVGIRYGIAALGMSLIFIKKWKFLNLLYIKHGLISGLFLFLGYFTQTIGCNYTTAGKNAFLTTIYVMLVPIITWIKSKKYPGIHIFIASFICLTGIALLALGNEDNAGLNKGDFLTLLCGIFFALHIVWTEKYNREGDDTLFLTLLQFVFCAIFGLILAFFMENPVSVSTIKSPIIIQALLYLGLLSTMLCFSLQNIGLKYVQSSIASLFLSFESVFGVLFSIIFLKERLSPKMLVGCILIFFAVVLAQTKLQFFKSKKNV